MKTAKGSSRNHVTCLGVGGGLTAKVYMTLQNVFCFLYIKKIKIKISNWEKSYVGGKGGIRGVGRLSA